MDLPTEQLAELPAEDIAKRLFDAGASLRGKNLRQKSWREIAQVLVTSGQLSAVVQSRLRAASTREDALRVLRIVRRAETKIRRGTRRRAARGDAAAPRVTTSQDVDSTEVDDFWDPRDPWDACHLGPDCCGVVDSDDRFEFTTRWVVDSALAHVRPFEALLTDTDPAPDDTMAHPPLDEPIEQQMSRHLVSATEGLADAAFMDRMCEAIGGPANISVIQSFAREQGCPDLAGRLCFFAPFWIRQPSAWSRKGSLLEHLFVRHPVPQYLYGEWIREQARSKWLCWFLLLGYGASLNRAAHHFSWRISRRFHSHLDGVPDILTPLEASMYAEVMQLGGTPVDFDRLAAHPAFVVDRTEPGDRPSYDRFWTETARWLITNHEAIDNEQAQQALDWAMHEHTENEGFTWRGRTVRSVRRRAAEYQRHFHSTGQPNRRWDNHGWDWDEGDWSFVELTSTAELAMEGRILHHCVASYDSRCLAGYSAIVSLRRMGNRCLTIELNPATLMVKQALGTCNRSSCAEESLVIARWLRELRERSSDEPD